jgi:hypothetical protein
MMSASWYGSRTLRSRQHCWLSRRLMETVNICTRNAAFVHCKGFNCLSYIASTYRNFVNKFSALLSFLVYVMKECRALVVYLHLFLTSALDGSEYWRSRSASFNAGEESQYPLWLGVGVLKKRKSLSPAGNRIIITRRPARSLVAVPTKLALFRGLTGCLQKSAWSVDFPGLMQSPHTRLIILGSIVSSSLSSIFQLSMFPLRLGSSGGWRYAVWWICSGFVVIFSLHLQGRILYPECVCIMILLNVCNQLTNRMASHHRSP